MTYRLDRMHQGFTDQSFLGYYVTAQFVIWSIVKWAACFKTGQPILKLACELYVRIYHRKNEVYIPHQMMC